MEIVQNSVQKIGVHQYTIFVVMFLTSIRLSTGKNNIDYYTVCSTTSYNFGQLQNIKYPFWGGNRPEFCGGGQNFRLTCQNDADMVIYGLGKEGSRWSARVLFFDCFEEEMEKRLLGRNKVLSTRLGRKPEDIIKLDANENPYGPPPEVFEALGNMKFPYIYPDPESRTLRAALAKDSCLESEYILAGCGADELIDLIMRCVLEPGDKIVDCPPTFTMYEFDVNVNAAVVIKVPRNADFSLDVERIIETVELEKPKCIFLTSPNNPDRSIISDDDLLRILNLPILVVLDEAYVEFSGLESRMKWVKQYENLIVLRTFSKRAGLAGLRVGYGASPASIIKYIWRAKQPYNVSVAAEVAACAALQNPAYLENVKDALVKERERLYKLLEEVPFLQPYPSYSNFILCKEDLAKMGVMIRHYNNKELGSYVRVSVGKPGKPEHTDALMEGLKCIC